jgi:hypothetical protein
MEDYKSHSKQQQLPKNVITKLKSQIQQKNAHTTERRNKQNTSKTKKIGSLHLP